MNKAQTTAGLGQQGRPRGNGVRVAIDGDDARLERVAGNASARIDRIDQAIERRRTVLLARFAAMESTIERLRWQQSTLLSIMGSLGSRS